MNNIDIFNNKDIILFRKVPKMIYSYTTILIITMVLFLIIGQIKYKKYSVFYAYVLDDNLLIECDYLPSYDDNLIFENKKYKYKLLDVTKQIFTIKVDIPKKHMIDNNVLEVRMIKEETTILKELKKIIWKDW